MARTVRIEVSIRDGGSWYDTKAVATTTLEVPLPVDVIEVTNAVQDSLLQLMSQAARLNPEPDAEA